MRKLIYILLLVPLLGSAQWETGLLVSKLQAGPENLYTLANAANPDEVNATTGIVAQADVTLISSSSSPQNGSYTLDAVNTTTGAAKNFRIEVPSDILEEGKTYEIKLYAHQDNQPTGNGWGLELPSWGYWESGGTKISMISKSGWTEYTLIGTASAPTNPTRFILVQNLSDTPIGTHVYVDNVRIKEVVE